MINVRYGLLSTAGVCFALALGVLVGAGPLQGDAEERHRTEQERAEQEREQLERQLEAAAEDQAHQDAFLGAVEPQLVDAALSGRAVVVVSLPGADDADTEAIVETIELAGAQVTGQVELMPRWVEPGQQQFLEDLTARLVTEDTELPEDGGAYDRAAAVLARALVTDDADIAGTADNGAAGIMSGMEAGELVTAPEELPRADLAVVVAGAEANGDAEPDADALEAANAAWTAVGRGLASAGTGVVLAGHDGESGAVAAVRSDDTASDEVSTVDGIGQLSGRVATVLALAEQVNGGVGHYGAAASADAPAPEPAVAAESPNGEQQDSDAAGDEDTEFAEPPADTDEDPAADPDDEAAG